MAPPTFVMADGRVRVVASKADEYRRRAQECLEMAAAFSDPDSRVVLSHMAQAWLGLAERIGFIAPVVTECAQPIVQQQQQMQPKQGQRGPEGLAKHEFPMPSHKFHIGETVTLIPSISRNVAGGIYQVVRQLPHNGIEFEYHIKSANEQHQRVVGDVN
jgi:hypothetical protein